MSKNTKVTLETAAKRAGLNILTGKNRFVDGVGAGRHSIHECHDEINAVFVSGRTYIPLSHGKACCGTGAWLSPGNERDALLAALVRVVSWIDNWSPDFTQDNEWFADEQMIRALITKATIK